MAYKTRKTPLIGTDDGAKFWVHMGYKRWNIFRAATVHKRLKTTDLDDKQQL